MTAVREVSPQTASDSGDDVADGSSGSQHYFGLKLEHEKPAPQVAVDISMEATDSSDKEKEDVAEELETADTLLEAADAPKKTVQSPFIQASTTCLSDALNPDLRSKSGKKLAKRAKRKRNRN